MKTNTIKFNLLVQLSTGSSFPIEKVQISCTPEGIFLDDQLTTVEYNQIQLRFEPAVGNVFTKPKLAFRAICFDGTDLSNPIIKDTFEKLMPFIK